MRLLGFKNLLVLAKYITHNLFFDHVELNLFNDRNLSTSWTWTMWNNMTSHIHHCKSFSKIVQLGLLWSLESHWWGDANGHKCRLQSFIRILLELFYNMSMLTPLVVATKFFKKIMLCATTIIYPQKPLVDEVVVKNVSIVPLFIMVLDVIDV